VTVGQHGRQDIVQGKNAGLQEPVCINLDALIKRVRESVNPEGDAEASDISLVCFW
jgi:hypothetical protein